MHVAEQRLASQLINLHVFQESHLLQPQQNMATELQHRQYTCIFVVLQMEKLCIFPTRKHATHVVPMTTNLHKHLQQH